MTKGESHANLIPNDLRILAYVMSHPGEKFGRATAGKKSTPYGLLSAFNGVSDLKSPRTLWKCLNTLKSRRIIWQDQEGRYFADPVISAQTIFVSEVKSFVMESEALKLSQHHPLFVERNVKGVSEALTPLLLDSLNSDAERRQLLTEGEAAPMQRFNQAIGQVRGIFSELWEKHILGAFNQKQRRIFDEYEKALDDYAEEMVRYRENRRRIGKLFPKEFFEASDSMRRHFWFFVLMRGEEESMIKDFPNKNPTPDPKKIKKLRRTLFNPQKRAVYEKPTDMPKMLLAVPISPLTKDLKTKETLSELLRLDLQSVGLREAENPETSAQLAMIRDALATMKAMLL